MKCYAAYRPSDIPWLDRIPANWITVPLRSVLRESKVRNSGMVESNLLSLSFGRIVRKDIDGVGGLLPESFETYQIVDPDHLVFRFTDLQNDQRSLRSARASERGIITSAYVSAEPTGIHARYAEYLMRSYDLTKVFYGLGGGVRQTLKFADVARLPVLLPPLEEQRTIADYLDRETARIETLIEEQHRLIAMLRERRQAVIESAVGRGLDPVTRMKPSGLFWTQEVPQHWTVANIRKFATMKTGHTPSRSNPEYWDDCTIPWFTLADVWQLRDGTRNYLGETASRISELGLANSAAELLPAGTVVLSRTASVGFSGIMPVEMATSQDFWNWIPGSALDAEYLMWTFRAMRSEFQSLMIGSTHKTIYQPTAAAFRIPVPPMSEQRRIAAYLDEQTEKIDALTEETERFLELAQERRAALITAAVTGQIDVRAVA